MEIMATVCSLLKLLKNRVAINFTFIGDNGDKNTASYYYVTFLSPSSRRSVADDFWVLKLHRFRRA